MRLRNQDHTGQICREMATQTTGIKNTRQKGTNENISKDDRRNSKEQENVENGQTLKRTKLKNAKRVQDFDPP
jgi:chemotaxis regulatin CheY-phosphate phosphatase CheZ